MEPFSILNAETAKSGSDLDCNSICNSDTFEEHEQLNDESSKENPEDIAYKKLVEILMSGTKTPALPTSRWIMLSGKDAVYFVSYEEQHVKDATTNCLTFKKFVRPQIIGNEKNKKQ